MEPKGIRRGDYRNPNNETTDCDINATRAIYVKKGDPSQICDPEMPLYPGDDNEHIYDLPVGPNARADWWNENTCIWKNTIIYNSENNARYTITDSNSNRRDIGLFNPATFNGDCTLENIHGINTLLDRLLKIFRYTVQYEIDTATLKVLK